MLKRIILIFFCLSFISFEAYAGDIPESLMSGDHQALFIGEIIDKDSKTYTIKPLTVMMGEVFKETVSVDKFEYYGTSIKPKVGDYLVVVLLEENNINNLWIFKTTSPNYRTLKLVSEKYNMVKRYEKYINEGAYFEAQRRIDEKNKREIGSTEIKTKESIISQNGSNESPEKKSNVTIILLAVTIVSLSIMFFRHNQ